MENTKYNETVEYEKQMEINRLNCLNSFFERNEEVEVDFEEGINFLFKRGYITKIENGYVTIVNKDYFMELEKTIKIENIENIKQYSESNGQFLRCYTKEHYKVSKQYQAEYKCGNFSIIINYSDMEAVKEAVRYGEYENFDKLINLYEINESDEIIRKIV